MNLNFVLKIVLKGKILKVFNERLNEDLMKNLMRTYMK